jgi:hypothetical protein
MNLVFKQCSFAATFLGSLAILGCSSDDSPGSATPEPDGGVSAPDGALPEGVPCVADESAPVPTDRCTDDPAAGSSLPQCGTWTKVEIPGTVCGNGSQYKFFVKYSNKSNNLVIDFEPGGACWDYESCSGAGGIRGAANPNGISDTHMTTLGLMPLLKGTAPAGGAAAPADPTDGWNKVFVSYCTGDIHTGTNVITYTSTDGNSSLEYHHAGHANTLEVIEWLNQEFTTVPKMLVPGCSAGGAGSILNYHFIREGMKGAQCGYMLNDSGPIFHTEGPSAPLHAKVRSSWNVDPILDSLEGKVPVKIADLKKDFGLINLALADGYPNDRLSITMYRMDFNYSLYSYQRFGDQMTPAVPNPSEQQIHDWWWQDIQGLIEMYDTRPNLAYFVPFWRSDNCSHCVSIPPIGNPPDEPLDALKAVGTPWLGSEIQASNLNLQDYVMALLDDSKPLQSYVEEPQSGEAFTPAVSNSCMEGGGTLPGQ